jgi:hypothetical protein
VDGTAAEEEDAVVSESSSEAEACASDRRIEEGYGDDEKVYNNTYASPRTSTQCGFMLSRKKFPCLWKRISD